MNQKNLGKIHTFVSNYLKERNEASYLYHKKSKVEYCSFYPAMRGRNCYKIKFTDSKEQYFCAQRNEKFEALFPTFPYHYSDSIQEEMQNINTRMELMDARIDKLVSHLEAIMIALKQSSVTGDNLDI
jgi:hypothetical protein